jgi:hypothetical protein
MWQIAAMMAVGAVSGVMEGDAIADEAEFSAKDLELEGARVRRNALGEAKDTYVEEQIAGGADSAVQASNNISTGMSESSHSNQMLAANRQAAMRESQSIIEEGERMNRLYKDRAATTLKVGKERAQKAVVNGIVGGAVSGYTMGKS